MVKSKKPLFNVLEFLCDALKPLAHHKALSPGYNKFINQHHNLVSNGTDQIVDNMMLPKLGTILFYYDYPNNKYDFAVDGNVLAYIISLNWNVRVKKQIYMKKGDWSFGFRNYVIDAGNPTFDFIIFCK